MKTLRFPLFRGALIVAMTLAVLAGSVRAAYAGNGASTWQNFTDTFVVVGSCSDPDGVYQITVVTNGAIHFVENANGYKFSWAEEGDYYIEPIAADSPVTYSGHYATHFVDTGLFTGGNFVAKNTLTSVGLGSDGTRETLHITTHVVLTPTGAAYEIENLQWICR